MPLEPENIGTPADWLRRARSNFALAGAKAEGVLVEERCFNLQQAVEKAIKGVLLKNGIQFPYTHQLAPLICLVKDAGINWPAQLDEADALSEYATAIRYPGPFEPVTEDEFDNAYAMARDVLDWAAAQMD